MSEHATKEALFTLARKELPNALLARTSAEVLFWFQHATRQDEGRPHVWKTGRELGEAVGLSARTASAHMKRLQECGLLTIRYAPRPGGISPVTWLTATPVALDLIARARSALRRGDRRTSRRPPLRGSGEAHTTVTNDDASASAKETPFQENMQSYTQEDSTASLHSAPGRRKGKAAFIDEGSLEPPEHLNVSPEGRQFVLLVQETLERLSLPTWEPSSKYTWQHGRRFLGALEHAGFVSEESQRALLDHLFAEWPWFWPALPLKYRDHLGNRKRPTPMVLGMEADLIVDLLQEKMAPKVKAGGSGVDDFC